MKKLLILLLLTSCSDNIYKVGKCYTARKESDGRMSKIIALEQTVSYTLFNDGVEPDASFVIWLKYFSEQARVVPCTERLVPRPDAVEKVKAICKRAKEESLKYDKAFCQKYGE